MDVNNVECAVKRINASQALDFNNLFYQNIVLADPMIYATLAVLLNAMHV